MSNAKYLGIILDCNLSWGVHNIIGAVTHKANEAHAFLQRNFKKCLVSSPGLLYIWKAILEYASVVWAPHTITANLLLWKRSNTGLLVLCVIGTQDMIASPICISC